MDVVLGGQNHTRRPRISHEAWPELPWRAWGDSLATLHMWTQIIGKLKGEPGTKVNVSFARTGVTQPIRVEMTRAIIHIPAVPTLLQPVVATVPLQVFACELATLKGHDVDQPRNLAKSVTVE